MIDNIYKVQDLYILDKTVAEAYGKMIDCEVIEISLADTRIAEKFPKILNQQAYFGSYRGGEIEKIKYCSDDSDLNECFMDWNHHYDMWEIEPIKSTFIETDYPIEREEGFPKILKHNDLNIVVEFTNHNSGVVIKSSNCNYHIGYYSNKWANSEDKYLWSEFNE